MRFSKGIALKASNDAAFRATEVFVGWLSGFIASADRHHGHQPTGTVLSFD